MCRLFHEPNLDPRAMYLPLLAAHQYKDSVSEKALGSRLPRTVSTLYTICTSVQLILDMFYYIYFSIYGILSFVIFYYIQLFTTYFVLIHTWTAFNTNNVYDICYYFTTLYVNYIYQRNSTIDTEIHAWIRSSLFHFLQLLVPETIKLLSPPHSYFVHPLLLFHTSCWYNCSSGLSVYRIISIYYIVTRVVCDQPTSRVNIFIYLFPILKPGSEVGVSHGNWK